VPFATHGVPRGHFPPTIFFFSCKTRAPFSAYCLLGQRFPFLLSGEMVFPRSFSVRRSATASLVLTFCPRSLTSATPLNFRAPRRSSSPRSPGLLIRSNGALTPPVFSFIPRLDLPCPPVVDFSLVRVAMYSLSNRARGLRPGLFLFWHAFSMGSSSFRTLPAGPPLNLELFFPSPFVFPSVL